jgi:hypothetical protein
VAVVSLDTAMHVNPLIWSADRLPYDCERLIAVPEPTGGALVLSLNTLIYVNQSVRIGVKLNELASLDESKFGVTTLDDDSMTLGGAHGAFVAPTTALLSVRSLSSLSLSLCVVCYVRFESVFVQIDLCQVTRRFVGGGASANDESRCANVAATTPGSCGAIDRLCHLSSLPVSWFSVRCT